MDCSRLSALDNNCGKKRLYEDVEKPLLPVAKVVRQAQNVLGVESNDEMEATPAAQITSRIGGNDSFMQAMRTLVRLFSTVQHSQVQESIQKAGGVIPFVWFITTQPNHPENPANMNFIGEDNWFDGS